MKLYVLDDYQNVVRTLSASELLAGRGIDLTILTTPFADEQAAIERLRDADGLVLIRERTVLSERIINALPSLRLVVQTGRLSGAVDLAACQRRDITVRDGGGSPVAPAELTWALILAAMRRLVPYVGRLQDGIWQRTAADLAEEGLGVAVKGRTLGIWGLGRIGQRVAVVGQAFGMAILVHGRAQTAESAEKLNYEYCAAREAFLSRADILSLHLKLTGDTRHLIGPEDLALMKPGSLLVNTSRAELIRPGALLAALDKGRPGFAAVDVYEDEPAGAAAYAAHRRVLATPHIGFVERDTYENYFATAFGQVVEFLGVATR